MHNQAEPPLEAAAPDPAPLSSGLLAEIGQLGRAVKHLFGAQLHLLAAELGLARSAISWIFVAGLAATVAGVGLGLSMLAFTGLKTDIDQIRICMPGYVAQRFLSYPENRSGYFFG